MEQKKENIVVKTLRTQVAELSEEVNQLQIKVSKQQLKYSELYGAHCTLTNTHQQTINERDILRLVLDFANNNNKTIQDQAIEKILQERQHKARLDKYADELIKDMRKLEEQVENLKEQLADARNTPKASD